MGEHVGPYKLLKTIGEGSYAKVKLAVHVSTHEVVAVKVIDLRRAKNKDASDQLKQEVVSLKLAGRHPNVVHTHRVTATRERLYIVGELVSGGDLFDLLARSNGRLPQDRALHIFAQIVAAVWYCHDHGICHRDLKPENVLLGHNGNVQITDFGLSAAMQGVDGLMEHACGTTHYIAPEVLRNPTDYSGEAADAWSLGCLLYTMVTGKVLLDVPQGLQEKELVLSLPDDVTEPARFLLFGLLMLDPRDRLTMQDLGDLPSFAPFLRPRLAFMREERKRSSSAVTPPFDNDSHQCVPVPALLSPQRASYAGPHKTNIFEVITLSMGNSVGAALAPPFGQKQLRCVASVRRVMSATRPMRILEVVQGALTRMNVPYKALSTRYKVRGELTTRHFLTKTTTRFTVQVMELLPPHEHGGMGAGVYVLEARKVKGLTDVFDEWFSRLMDDAKFKAIVNKPQG